jgi:hypothetical protein
MKAGVVSPQTEIGSDPGAIRDYVQAAEGLGYSHLIVYDHVLGADTNHYPNWQGSYSSKESFHEPFVLSGHLASWHCHLDTIGNRSTDPRPAADGACRQTGSRGRHIDRRPAAVGDRGRLEPCGIRSFG